jgi:hypothetical protein
MGNRVREDSVSSIKITCLILLNVGCAGTRVFSRCIGKFIQSHVLADMCT